MGKSSMELQTKLFLNSLLVVLDYTDAAMECEDDVTRTSDRLMAFFRDVDYADFSNLKRYWFRGNNLASHHGKHHWGQG
ncbi:hypothetical protein AN958_00089 [Leucoagaricus sp. SymC.cos]|nr:hypothetical protein AN958_00089 [Leucoagaricus sp. SymC.cos]